MKPSCDHPSKTYFPGYRYALCQTCYDDAYAVWFERAIW